MGPGAALAGARQADGSTSAATHRLPPTASRLRMARHRAFAGTAARPSIALRAASQLPATQRHAPTVVTPARIRVAAPAPHARRAAADSAVEVRGRSPVAAVTRPVVAEATAAATDENALTHAEGGGTEGGVLLTHVCRVPLVLEAVIIDQIAVENQWLGDLHGPGRGVGFGIVDRNLDLEGPEVRTPDPFGHFALVREWISAGIQPEIVAKTDGVHHERVTIPVAG